MLRRIVIDVPELTFERLSEVAEQQRRDPKSQAVVLLERALRRVVLPGRERERNGHHVAEAVG
jgi:hypothetical protein